jgi:hypothetical protein
MSNATLKQGDRVKLKPTHRWEKGHDNPTDVVGTVQYVGGRWVDVEWDNGGFNGYLLSENDLTTDLK